MEWAGSGTLNVNGLIPDRVERGVVKSNLLPSNISSWNVNEPMGRWVSWARPSDRTSIELEKFPSV